MWPPLGQDERRKKELFGRASIRGPTTQEGKKVRLGFGGPKPFFPWRRFPALLGSREGGDASENGRSQLADPHALSVGQFVSAQNAFFGGFWVRKRFPPPRAGTGKGLVGCGAGGLGGRGGRLPICSLSLPALGRVGLRGISFAPDRKMRPQSAGMHAGEAASGTEKRGLHPRGSSSW